MNNTACTFTAKIAKCKTAQLPQPFIILGDVNAHSKTWGSYKINDRGKIFDKLLQDNPSLFLLNTGQPTRFDAFNGTFSAIDLSISSTTISHALTWQTHLDICQNDHYPILIYAPTTKQYQKLKPQKWILGKADWMEFNKLCSELYNQDPDCNIDTLVHNFNQHIIKAASKAIPKSSSVVKPKQVP